MNSTLSDYDVVGHCDDEGSYVAHVPAIAGCYALGRSTLEARAELQNVFEMICDERSCAPTSRETRD